MAVDKPRAGNFVRQPKIFPQRRARTRCVPPPSALPGLATLYLVVPLRALITSGFPAQPGKRFLNAKRTAAKTTSL